MQKLIGNHPEGRVFVLSGPAGTGKTTLVCRLVDEFPEMIQSISFTTRAPRLGEISGVHYQFISDSEFEEKVAANEFLEYVKLYGYYYGTSRKWVEEQRQQGKHVILVIDTQGALQLQKKFSATFIFIEPPSMEALRLRLKKRRTESDAVIAERLDWAKKEIEVANRYDYRVVNEDIDIAYNVLRSIVIAEDHRVIKKS